VASNFAQRDRQPRRRASHWWPRNVAFTVAVIPTINGEAKGCHGDAVARLGHAAQGRKVAVHRRSYLPSRTVDKKATVSHRNDLQLTAGKNLSPHVLIHPPRARVLNAGGTNRGGGVIDSGGKKPEILLQLLYHGEYSSDSLTEQLQGNFSLYFS
jgi:hypothetical protein